LISPLTVNYSIAAGAAKAGSADVTPALTNSVTIPAGQAFVDLIVTPVNDALFEGTETLTLTVFDTGNYDVGTPASASVTIADTPDTTAPVITIAADVTVIWPPNGQMVPDRISGRITDALSGVDPSSLAYRVTDSYGAVQPAGSFEIDSIGRFAFTVALEASRRGDDKDGRRYVVIVTAIDRAGNSSSASVAVIVPHDKGK
jgi:hypothetical protein